jgi:small-conductance mechanosensitive channel
MGGLLLFDKGYEGGNVLIHRDIPPPYVYNPYTGKFLQLPGMLGTTWIQLRCIAEDNNGAYKVVVKDAMNDTKTAVNKLHQMVNVVIGVVIIVIWLLILGIATTHILVVVSSQLLLVVFMFGNSCKMAIESIIFLFVMHPFDVGDRC